MAARTGCATMASLLDRISDPGDDIEELASSPTLHSGQFDKLKYDDGTYRIWLSRTSRADWAGPRMPGGLPVTVEKLRDGRWVAIYGDGA